MTHKRYDIPKDLRYLQLLSHSFPTIAEASTEIINLQAILNLPKATEHFVADIHGEYEAFQQNELFGTTLRDAEKRELCTLIYYPEQKLELVKASEPDINDWYHITLHHLVAVCRDVSSKYTRSKVRKSLPLDFSYIIQELLHERTEDTDKTAYVKVIIDTIISTGRADDFIIAISKVIQQLAIDQLHILGDIYDRGPGAHKIMDMLENYHSWDITWGNHDILWMGAAAGNDACLCNVIRLSLRYANLMTLEEGYGINLVPLATFAMDVYGDDPCTEFMPKLSGGAEHLDEKTQQLIAREHKAISVLQFKLEAQLFDKHPEWNMRDRELFNDIDYKKGTIHLNGKEYKLTSCHFPTVDPAHPNVLTNEELDLINKLHHSFEVSEKLHKHIRTQLTHGCMFGIDPFTMQCTFFDDPYGETDSLQTVYYDLIDAMPNREPILLYDTVKHIYSCTSGMDVTCCLPRTRFIEDNIPDWKLYNGKVLYTLDRRFIDKNGFPEGCVSAFLKSEGEQCVPIDQYMYGKDEKEFKLALYKGEYLLRFDDGKEYKYATITVK